MIDINLPFFLDLNYFDDATLTGGAKAAMPLANLKTQNPRQAWGSVDLSSPSITIAFDPAADIEINALAVIRHNLTVDGKFSLYGHSVNDFSNLAAVDFKLENIEAFPSLYGAGEGEVGFMGAGGVPRAIDLPLYNETAWTSFDLQELKYWKIVFSDPGNPDGYIKVGRIMLGYGWQPVYGLDWDHDLADVDPSRQERTEGGGVHVDAEPHYRKLSFTFSNLEDQERYFRAYKTQKLVGKTRAVFVSLYPDPAKAAFFFESGYFLPTDISPIKRRRRDFNSVKITMEELI